MIKSIESHITRSSINNRRGYSSVRPHSQSQKRQSQSQSKSVSASIAARFRNEHCSLVYNPALVGYSGRPSASSCALAAAPSPSPVPPPPAGSQSFSYAYGGFVNPALVHVENALQSAVPRTSSSATAGSGSASLLCTSPRKRSLTDISEPVVSEQQLRDFEDFTREEVAVVERPDLYASRPPLLTASSVDTANFSESSRHQLLSRRRGSANSASLLGGRIQSQTPSQIIPSPTRDAHLLLSSLLCCEFIMCHRLDASATLADPLHMHVYYAYFRPHLRSLQAAFIVAIGMLSFSLATLFLVASQRPNNVLLPLPMALYIHSVLSVLLLLCVLCINCTRSAKKRSPLLSSPSHSVAAAAERSTRRLHVDLLIATMLTIHSLILLFLVSPFSLGLLHHSSARDRTSSASTSSSSLSSTSPEDAFSLSSTSTSTSSSSPQPQPDVWPTWPIATGVQAGLPELLLLSALWTLLLPFRFYAPAFVSLSATCIFVVTGYPWSAPDPAAAALWRPVRSPFQFSYFLRLKVSNTRRRQFICYCCICI